MDRELDLLQEQEQYRARQAERDLGRERDDGYELER